MNVQTPLVKLGEEVVFHVELEAEPKAQVNVDFAIHFMKANGSLNKKVFKLRKFEMDEGGKKTLTRKHRIEQLSTRKIYAGKHGISLIINGRESAIADFEVVF